MIERNSTQAVVALGIAVLAAATVATGAEAPAPTRNLFFQAAYLREPADQVWHFRITGNVPSLPGCVVIVHDAADRILLRRHVPYGKYPSDKPLVIEVPKDGIVGDYRVVIVGQQQDILELNLPLTDLPLEVYGHTHFAARPQEPLLFQVPAGVTQMTFSSYSGGMRVLENGQKLVDTKTDGELKDRNLVATAKVRPGAEYQLEPYGTFYFGVPDGVFLTYSLSRWFSPDPKLEETKWWQLLPLGKSN